MPDTEQFTIRVARITDECFTADMRNEAGELLRSGAGKTALDAASNAAIHAANAEYVRLHPQPERS